ncbi:MFS transporter [Eupransor demetentiae]|uniref:Includes anhydromuropeptide permease AmpG (ProP) n=1 Tax=Eupransor demetentiae TaxID=3109584 RepID=A0ABM9N336_9LACO|nr:MFS family permease [Lactobacillaceae bacterium LMG 33000]
MDNAATLRLRMDATGASPLFYKVFVLVAAGMILDAADVYLASAVNTTIIQTKFATLGQGSIFLSSGFLGLFFGSLLAGFIGDRFGRRQAYQINLLIFGGFTLLAAFSGNVWWLIAFRFIAAIGLGAEIVTGFSFINEFAPVKTRGRWSASVSMIANCAAPLTLLLASFIIPNYSWRTLMAMVGVAALILWVMRHNFPESPRWLISQGRYDEAEAIIEQMEVARQQKLEDAKEDLAIAQKVSPGRALAVAIVAVSAINLIQYTFTSWMPTLLVRQGIQVVHSLSFSAVMLAGAPIGALTGAILVDHLGRKKVIVSAFIAAAILGMIYAYQREVTPILIVGFILVTVIYILMASIVSVYMPELFRTDFRFRGTGIANAVAKILTVFTPYMAAWALARFNANLIFIVIAGIALIAAVTVAFMGPETKQGRID